MKQGAAPAAPHTIQYNGDYGTQHRQQMGRGQGLGWSDSFIPSFYSWLSFEKKEPKTLFYTHSGNMEMSQRY